MRRAKLTFFIIGSLLNKVLPTIAISSCATIQKTDNISNFLLNLDINSFVHQISQSFLETQVNGEEWNFRDFFLRVLESINLTAKRLNTNGSSLMAKTISTYFLLEFKVNSVARQALSLTKKYSDRFNFDDRDILCIGINYYVERADKIVCSWMAELYSEDGAFKEHFSRKELRFSNVRSVIFAPQSTPPTQTNHQPQQTKPPTQTNYQMQETIGKGTYSDVYKCVERKTGKQFAAKKIHNNLDAEEICTMKILHHKNLLGLHDSFKEGNNLVLIVEYLEGKNLYELKNSRGDTLSEDEIKNYVRQICSAIKYMHENNILYLDVKPQNVVTKTKFSQEVKLIDFGLAVKLKPSELKDGICVQHICPEYWAPEIVERKMAGLYTDMWGLGFMVYFLLSGSYPFNGEQHARAHEFRPNFDVSSLRRFSVESKNFIKRLLVKNEKYRMTIQECVNHPWLVLDNASLPTSQHYPYPTTFPTLSRSPSTNANPFASVQHKDVHKLNYPLLMSDYLREPTIQLYPTPTTSPTKFSTTSTLSKSPSTKANPTAMLQHKDVHESNQGPWFVPDYLKKPMSQHYSTPTTIPTTLSSTTLFRFPSMNVSPIFLVQDEDVHESQNMGPLDRLYSWVMYKFFQSQETSPNILQSQETSPNILRTSTTKFAAISLSQQTVTSEFTKTQQLEHTFKSKSATIQQSWHTSKSKSATIQQSQHTLKSKSVTMQKSGHTIKKSNTARIQQSRHTTKSKFSTTRQVWYTPIGKWKKFPVGGHSKVRLYLNGRYRNFLPDQFYNNNPYAHRRLRSKYRHLDQRKMYYTSNEDSPRRNASHHRFVHQ